MTATEAARSFSDVLNRVSAGDEIEITRNGATVAVIAPPPRKKKFVPPEEFRALMESLPPVDEDFVHDLEEIRRSVGPPRDPWAS
jgi:prevent-host-death family protein